MEKEIILERIDVDIAAKNFAKMLDEKKENFFLNGSWGSGKTEFLEEVKKNSKKKFINLNLWDMKDDRNVITIAYSKLHPILYRLAYIVATVAIIVAVPFSPKIIESFLNFVGGNKETNLLDNIVVTIALIIVAVYSIWRNGNFKKESFYYATMKWFLKKPHFFKEKVLVVDDFDRVDSKVKEEAYKLFNLLNGLITIVFLGDIIKIVEEREGGKNGENFLQKIIDSSVELPFALHSNQVWDDYFEKLASMFEDSDGFDELERIFISERRNLRDRERFNEMVNREFIERGKYGHVQPYQQLLVIYAYLFHPKIYSKLLFNKDIDVSEEYRKFIDLDDDGAKEFCFLGKKTFEDLVYDMQKDRKNAYPKRFAQDRQSYYLYEEVSNLPVTEIENIIKDRNKLDEKLLLVQDNDFYVYILANYSRLSVDYRYQLLGFTLYLIKENYSTPALIHIVNKTDEIITTDFISNSKSIDIENECDIYKFKRWWTILKAKGFDISQIFYFLESFRIISSSEIVKLNEDIDLIDNHKYAKLLRKDYYVLYYLRKKKYFEEYEKWPDIVWKRVNEMSDLEWLSFWIYMGEIHPIGPVSNSNKAFPSARKYLFGRRNPTKSNPPSTLVKNIIDRRSRLAKSKYILVMDE